MRYFFIITVCLTLNSVFSQVDLGSWNTLNVRYNHSKKYSFFAESQLRSLKYYRNFHYYEYKGGINYKFHENAVITLAGGRYQTFQEGGNFVTPKNSNETRIWPQFVMNQQIGKFKVEQRYRAEFRFVNQGFRNRFRYRVGATFPILEKTELKNKLFLIASNEIFFTNREPYFERNRLFMGFNYKHTDLLFFQVGYLHQFDYKINDEIGRDFLLIGLYFEFFRKSSKNE
jgi:hypothetical protein